MNNSNLKIEVACDTVEAEAFAAWLNAKGHTATVGRSTGNYIDGSCTGSSPEASGILNALWDEYCNG